MTHPVPHPYSYLLFSITQSLSCRENTEAVLFRTPKKSGAWEILSSKWCSALGRNLHLAHTHLKEFTTSNFIPKTHSSLKEPEQKSNPSEGLRQWSHHVTRLKIFLYSSKGMKGTWILWSTAPHGFSSHKEENIYHKTLLSNLQESGQEPWSARKLISSNHPPVPLLLLIQTAANPTEVKKLNKITARPQGPPFSLCRFFFPKTRHNKSKETFLSHTAYLSNAWEITSDL